MFGPNSNSRGRARRVLAAVAAVGAVALVSTGCKAVENLTNPGAIETRVITVAASPPSLPDGGGDVDVTATVTLGGKPEAGVSVSFESSGGTWQPDSRATTDEAGKAQRTLRATGPTTITVKLQAGGVTLVTSNPVEIEVGGQQAAGAAELELTTNPKEPVVGEATKIQVQATHPDDGSWAAGELLVKFGDGKQKTIGDFSGQTSFEHTWREASVFNVVAELTEADGTLSASTFPVKVQSAGATAIILTATAEEIAAREPMKFRLRPEDDRGRVRPADVKVDWGDGRSTRHEIDQVTTVEHTFREPGSYRVLAELMGSSGSQARASVRVRVTERITVAGELRASDTTPIVDESVRFTFIATQSDGKRAEGTANVNFGDGTTTSVSVSGSREFSHTYTRQGSFTVEADFADGDDHTARATLRVDVQAESSGGGGGGGGGTGGGGGGSDAIDPGSIAWLHANTSSWSVTSTITNVSISGGQICISHTKAGGWPVVSGIEGNPWVVANIGGRWYAGTYEWLRPGQICKNITAATIGPHVKASPLSGWRPKSGETVYFMVSTPGRAGVFTINQRSNLVKVIWP